MVTLPLVTLIWTSEGSIVAAGDDCQPCVFSGNENGWRIIGSLDDMSAPKSGLTPSRFSPVGPGRSNNAALDAFKNADSGGLSSPGGGGGSSQGESALFTIHQDTITSLRPYEGQSGAITKVSTTGVDGKLVVWNVGAVTVVTVKLGNIHLRYPSINSPHRPRKKCIINRDKDSLLLSTFSLRNFSTRSNSRFCS